MPVRGGGAAPGASGRVVVVGLGPGAPDLVGAGVVAAVDRIPVRFVRTSRHPSAGVIPGATSFDPVYDAAESLADVYPAIVERLVAAAAREGVVLYAVPGSPFVAERSVELLRAQRRVEVEVVPALSFLDLAWDRLAVDPLAAGVRLVDGQRFATEAAGQPGPLLVAQCDTRMVLSEIKLAVDDGPDVVVLARLGLPGESVRTVGWADIDRDIEPDHLTTLWVPRLAAPVAAEVTRFAELVRTLRERCPWDREQTHRSLTPHLLEEAYEVAEAIDELDAGDELEGSDELDGGGGLAAGEVGAGGDAIAHLEEELGDVLFQVVFHATLAAEKGWFDLADVAGGIHDKLVRRHPHVFGDVRADTAGAVVANWDAIKRAEKGRTRILEGVPGNLPALAYAHTLQRKAASVGFDWDDASGAVAKVAEELAELQAEIDRGDADAQREELGDLLFAVVNVARHLDVDPESTLRAGAAKFRRRIDAVEARATARGVRLSDLDLAALDGLWEEAKRGE